MANTMSAAGISDEGTIQNNKSSYTNLIKQQKELRKEIKKLDKATQKEEFAAKKKQLEELYAHEQELQNNLLKEKAAKQIKLDEEIARKNAETWSRSNVSETIGGNIAKAVERAINSGLGELKSKLETTMNSWLDKQESIAYNLNGSFTTASKISSNLTKAIGGTGIVKQQEVYEKLTSLVESGIFYNVEQRAYLATLSEDLGMAFDVTNKSLNRLIRLQSNDLSDNRMAIEASLKTFLNQNYQTSEYIKDGFYDVSQSLLEAQSLMSSTSAMSLESVIQQWMGSLYSVGMSSETINSLSSAIGNLGSGNIGALSGSNIGRLLNMGASVAGLSYSDLLTNGLNQTKADQLMSGIVSYISSMNDNSSNVVKSSLAEIFGINVSDIIAASNLSGLGSPTANGIISDNIADLLGKTDSYVYVTQKISNILENFIYDWGTAVASNESRYKAYKATDIASKLASTMLDGSTISLKLFGSGVDIDVGKVLSNAALVTTIGGLTEAAGSLFNNLGSGAGAVGIYKTLSGLGQGDNIKMTGNVLDNISTGTSSSAIMSTKYGVNLDTNAAALSAKTSATSQTDFLTTDAIDENKQWQENITNSLDSLITEVKSIPLNPFNTYTRIAEAANTVTIGNDMTSIQSMIADSTTSLRNIYSLLSSYFINANTAGSQTSTASSDTGWLTSGGYSISVE